MAKIEVFLVPGFMGFDAIARLQYFEDVESVLARHLRERGYEARVVSLGTVPAGALEKRAAHLMRALLAAHDRDCSSIHLLGHSTGGLDIRILLSPGSEFDVGGEFESRYVDEGKPEERAERKDRYAHVLTSVRSAMGLATPHYGTPVAKLLLKIGMDTVLRDLSKLDDDSRTRRLVASGVKLAASLAYLLEAANLSPGFLKWMNDAVLSRNPDGVIAYLDSLGEDLGALRNLTQEAATLIRVAVRSRPGVDYASFCTGTQRPSGAVESDDPFVRLFTAFFRRTWPIVAKRDPAYAYAPRELVAQAEELYARDVREGRAVGVLSLDESTNDGVVPTYSQMYGRVAAVVASDHLDCIGMYRHGTTSGWVHSGAHFDDARFEHLWGRVAQTIDEAHRAREKS